MKAGALLPAGTGVTIESVIVDDYKSIQQMVGGAFDCVRLEIEDGEVIVGYVHDEGLLLGLPTNWYASALFGREIVGPCVVLGATSPTGEYDGDDYDLPKGFFQFLTGVFAEHVRTTYNESVLVTLGINIAQKLNLVTDDEMREFQGMLQSFADPEQVYGWLDMISERVIDYVATKEAKNLDEELAEFMGGKW